MTIFKPKHILMSKKKKKGPHDSKNYVFIALFTCKPINSHRPQNDNFR